MKRIQLSRRQLPDYTKGEEQMNTVTHIVGGGLAVIMALLCILRASHGRQVWSIVGCCIYSVSMITLYTMSSVYHGLRPGMGKKVMQVMDHCTIYLLIAGTYTPILLSALLPVYPVIAWGLFAFEWGLTVLAVTLTAIDLRKFRVFSMVCYICMGWAIFPFMRQVMAVIGRTGFLLLLSGGISYTVGAVLYGLGKKKRWMHSIFHILVVIGSVLQFFSIFLYCL